MTKKRGDAAKLYYSPATLMASGETPVDVLDFALVKLVKDLTQELSKDELDITTRDSNGWEEVMSGIKKGGLTFEVLWDPDEASFTKLRDAFLNDTKVCMVALDGLIATTGSQGLASNMEVTGFSRNEPVNGPMTANVTVKPSSETQWYEVA